MGHLTDARTAVQEVVAQIQEDWTAYPLVVELDNRSVVDQGQQTKPYLKVRIVPMRGGGQSDLADRPFVEQRGQILLYACAREGSGAGEADALLDFITDYFDMAVLGTLHCTAVEATEPKNVKGWREVPAIVNYWYHRLSN